MTITTTTTLSCTRCGQVFGSRVDKPFARYDLKREARQAGWRIDRGPEWWEDVCVECLSKEKRER